MGGRPGVPPSLTSTKSIANVGTSAIMIRRSVFATERSVSLKTNLMCSSFSST